MLRTKNIKPPFVLLTLVWIVLWGLSFVFTGLTWENRIMMTVVTGIAILTPAYCDFGSKAAAYIMAVISLMLGFGVILNAYCFTAYSGGTPTAPVLENGDFERWWSDALYHLGDSAGQKAAMSHGYYGYVLASALFLFGKTVGTALLWSMTMTLASVLVVGKLSYKVLKEKRLAALGMVCFASVCYMLCMGTVILKDAFIILAMSIAVYGMTCRGRKFFFIILLAALMIFVSRRNYLFTIIVGMAILSFKRGNRATTLGAAMVCLILWVLPEFLGYKSGIINVITADEKTLVRYDSNQQMAFYKIIGDYTVLPFWKKILYLPFCAVVQYFIPFPWNFTRDFDGGFTMLYAHISYMWYIFGFNAMYFFVSQWRKFRTPLYRLALFGFLCWLLPCYLFGGTISRYALCSVAIMAPAVAYTVYHNYKSKKYYIWFAAYAVVVGIVLIVAHHLQTTALQCS